ncbi:MAG: hypothetical protein JWN03_1201 [Nocardia sp.]|uniref:hypothetical protein n=1 Tax=Nocardia sp. TaxID=1821 RepID=UPI0026047440|nr:hypothetical protein [Nocardia sp.]MCU1640926.1 hypothetical protein [Nocardia sp.]
MDAFECIAEGGTYHSTFAVQPNRIALWSAAFGLDSLAGLFDMTPAEIAIPKIDAAVGRFETDPETLRPLVASDDPIGLFGNRKVLLKLRGFLATNGGTISGIVDQDEGNGA